MMQYYQLSEGLSRHFVLRLSCLPDRSDALQTPYLDRVYDEHLEQYLDHLVDTQHRDFVENYWPQPRNPNSP